MKKYIFLVLVSFSCIAYGQSCDLTCGNYFHFPYLPIDSPFIPKIAITNSGLHKSSTVDVIVNITGKTDSHSYYSCEVLDSNIAPTKTDTLILPLTWFPKTVGVYVMHISLFCSNDTNTANNFWTDTLTVADQCGITTEWHPGPAMQIVQNLSYFPKDAVLEHHMRPGDVIGLACYVKDLDILVQKCSCDGNIKSQAFGPYADNVKYDWKLDPAANGKLILPKVTEKNAVLYQLPLCTTNAGSNRIVDTVFCTVSNGGDGVIPKAQDKPLSGMIIITSLYCAKEFMEPGGAHQSEGVTVIVRVIPLVQEPDENIQLEDQPACIPASPFWDTITPIRVIQTIKDTTASLLCPDYLVILSAEGRDTDRILLTCSAKGNCSRDNESVLKVTDPVQYSWTTDDNCEFPLGNFGSSVIYWKSHTQPIGTGDVRCNMLDSRTEANDKFVFSGTLILPPKRPWAFVGVGNIDGWDPKLDWSLDYSNYLIPHFHSAFNKTAEKLALKLFDAGYNVSYRGVCIDEELSALRDPCYQVIVICSHGGDGSLSMAKELVSFYPEDVDLLAKKEFNCHYSPFIHEVDLLACETQYRHKWDRVFPCARIFGFETKVTTLKMLLWAHYDYFPTPPHDLCKP